MAIKENVVYICGAGFSAPLGLPLISNFLEKSKDQYQSDTKRFKHFEPVFETIRRISYATQTYALKLQNIEEVLSVLEMEGLVNRAEDYRSFTEYILDVIGHYTPPIQNTQRSAPWQNGILPLQPWDGYTLFMLLAGGYEISWKGASETYELVKAATPKFSYSFVSLNYDMVLENSAYYVSKKQNIKLDLFRPSESRNLSSGEGCSLAKLHGSTDSRIIIPPTWSKGNLPKQIVSEWALAYELLGNAHHIRIIGYSLPENDTYVRYLLHAAAVKSSYLKSIDVLCFDADNSVEKRYKDFLRFHKWRFKSGRIDNFFQRLLSGDGQVRPSLVDGNLIETAHQQSMN